MKSEKDWLVLAAEFDELQEYVAGKESTLIIKKNLLLNIYAIASTRLRVSWGNSIGAK